MNKRRGSNLTRRNEHGTEERTKAVCCGAEGLGKKKGRQLGDGEDRLFMLGIWFTICQIFAFTLSSLKYSRQSGPITDASGTSHALVPDRPFRGLLLRSIFIVTCCQTTPRQSATAQLVFQLPSVRPMPASDLAMTTFVDVGRTAYDIDRTACHAHGSHFETLTLLTNEIDSPFSIRTRLIPDAF